MTGFASATGNLAPYSWSWELRAVNGKGQDLRLRVPDWVEGLEPQLRKKLAAGTQRGTVTLSLKLAREEGVGALRVNSAHLNAMLGALSQIEDAAMNVGVSLAPSKATDIAALRGVLDASDNEETLTPLLHTLLREADNLIASFNDMRAEEGRALADVLRGQLDEIEGLTAKAQKCATARQQETCETLKRNLDRLLDNADGLDEARLTQELALIAVKSDVTEEIDRLAAHVVAARELLKGGGPVGRKLDFLMQEFNREANTLCAKAQNTDLTRIGLSLKALIDQMREQVQNVE
ncbi:MAG: YicC/YloC family endoribonuclease [Pseudomonadota bacterium]